MTNFFVHCINNIRTGLGWKTKAKMSKSIEIKHNKTFMEYFAESLNTIFVDKETAIIDIQEIKSLIDIDYINNFIDAYGEQSLRRAINFEELKIFNFSEIINLVDYNDLHLIKFSELNLIDINMLVRYLKDMAIYMIGIFVITGTFVNFIVFNSMTESNVVKGKELSVNEVRYISSFEARNTQLDVSSENYFDGLINQLDNYDCHNALTENFESVDDYRYVNGFKVITLCTIVE